MPRTYVALDLETTGLDPERDAIIEIGAVKFCDNILDTYSTFVNPGRPIPPPITELTGIADGDVRSAPGLYDVLPELLEFLSDHPIVGHSVDFDLACLAPHTDALDNASYDTFELASILVTEADRYSLISLTTLLGLELDQAHRALDDAAATSRLFRALLERAAGLPPRILKEIIGHGERAGWLATDFFRAALEEAARRPDLRRDQAKSQSATGPLFAPPEGAEPLEPHEMRRTLNFDRLAALLEEGGRFETEYPSYEYRPQQIEMLRRVAQAFNRSDHLLVEAPTGVGKSLAYLVPAVHWATQNGERVVISTNTINLQEQLYHKDLPNLDQVLPFDFRAAILKGRSHYLCPARLQALRRRGAQSPDEARFLAKVLVWSLGTRDGDGDDLFLPTAAERGMWWRLSADHEGCEPDRCSHFRHGECYFYRARRAAEASHLVIVNHALLLADVAVQNRALPEYRYLIVDEAHHLEDATTNGLSFDVDRNQFYRLMRQVGRVGQNGKVTGLLGDVLAQCRKAHLPREILDKIEMVVGKIGLAASRSRRQINQFFDDLFNFIIEHRGQRRSRYSYRLRLTSGVRVQPAWETVEIAWDDVRIPLVAVVDGMERVASALDELHEFQIPDVEDLQVEMLSVARRLGEATEKLHQMITEPSESLIYWLDLDRNDEHLRLHAAPLHVGPLVEENLFGEKESVILTSATLRTAGTFDFLRERLNAWEADELAVGSPFDYEQSTLVYLLQDIPEPNERGYQRAVAQGMEALFRATRGRALALFTSYSQLRATYRMIRAPLMQAGITVEAQGQGISRAQLLDNFRTGKRQVLLGTRSFWEGVDVPGEALSCLAIAKLPFSVPSDPIFAARSETFDHPFMDYAIPETILNFLQGFGRLIRTSSDRGVVAIFDKRLISKSYGDLFLESLPNPTIHRGTLPLLPKAAAKWLAKPAPNDPNVRQNVSERQSRSSPQTFDPDEYPPA